MTQASPDTSRPFDRKDELILALTEMVQELVNKNINLRVDAGLQLKAKDAELARLKCVAGQTNQAEGSSYAQIIPNGGAGAGGLDGKGANQPGDH
jgi:hypothetical protein